MSGDMRGFISYAEGVPPTGGGSREPSLSTPLPDLPSSVQSKISAHRYMHQNSWRDAGCRWSVRLLRPESLWLGVEAFGKTTRGAS